MLPCFWWWPVFKPLFWSGLLLIFPIFSFFFTIFTIPDALILYQISLSGLVKGAGREAVTSIADRVIAALGDADVCQTVDVRVREHALRATQTVIRAWTAISSPTFSFSLSLSLSHIPLSVANLSATYPCSSLWTLWLLEFFSVSFSYQRSLAQTALPMGNLYL